MSVQPPPEVGTEEQQIAPLSDKFIWKGGDLRTSRGKSAPRIRIFQEQTQDIASSAIGRLAQDNRDEVKEVTLIDAKQIFELEIRLRSNDKETYGLRVLTAGESVRYGDMPLHGMIDGKELPGVAVRILKTAQDVSEALLYIVDCLTAEKNYVALFGGMETKKAEGVTCIPSAALLRVVMVKGAAPAVGQEGVGFLSAGLPGGLSAHKGFTPGAPGAASTNAKEVGDR